MSCLQQIVGSDIAELLLQNPSAEETPDSRALIDFSEGPAPYPEPCVVGEDLLTGSATHTSAESSKVALDKYTALLLAGRKKVHDIPRHVIGRRRSHGFTPIA